MAIGGLYCTKDVQQLSTERRILNKYSLNLKNEFTRVKT